MMTPAEAKKIHVAAVAAVDIVRALYPTVSDLVVEDFAVQTMHLTLAAGKLGLKEHYG